MASFHPFLDTSTPDLPVRGFLHQPDTPNGVSLVLTHGAGSNCQATLLVALAEAFCVVGITVLRCDLPFRQSRPTGPPPRGSAERDQAGLRAAVSAMRSLNPGRVFLGGHSYGGRQASMLAATDPSLVPALLLLSYPLHPPNRPAELRTNHFPDLKTPALFVHGMRDGFASTAELEAARNLIPAPTQLLSTPNAGHELLTPRNRGDLPQQIVAAFLAFVS
jgi:uncharacterized protein